MTMSTTCEGRGREGGVRDGCGEAGVGPLSFMCPGCGVVLTIADPSRYDGRPAPCPQCAAVVMPPRICGSESEGTLDLHPRPGLSAMMSGRLKMPRVVSRGSTPGVGLRR